LKNEVNQDQFYTARLLLEELIAECELFERAGLKVLPSDVVNILFRCKLLFAARTEHEYRQRGGGGSFFDDLAFYPQWSDRSERVEILISRYVEGLLGQIRERTLLTSINSFASAHLNESLQTSFDNLIEALGFPFVSFFDGEPLIEKHRLIEPGLPAYDQAGAKQFFCAPSIGFRSSGSRAYCHWRSAMWLRTFLNMLRIANYIRPGQRVFGREVKMMAPTNPVFLGEHAQGCYAWSEDK